ncbi:GNAT family N-acetyltransferase [Hahella ganghwensis]|uniref:GNAT family N-acetyltransferase n=1 Tax=Hahella ganghwensis TaxID=286420 RepID=UPI000365C388|nr:GNAT family N-acetyltransferase [Hahella ganghwensis]
MEVKIRIATEQDLPTIVDIYNSTVGSRKVTADIEPVSVESRRNWYHRHSKKRPLFVMEQESKVIGWLSFEDFYGRPAYSGTAEISIYMHEDSRGAGHGDCLLRHAINSALQIGLNRLVAFIFAHNEPSISLFQKYGFVKWGELPDVAEIDGEKYSLLILGLVL